jgi:hypothetical protein
MSQLGISAN